MTRRFGIRGGADAALQAGLAGQSVSGDEVHRGRDEAHLQGLQGPVSHGRRARGDLQDHLLAVLPPGR